MAQNTITTGFSMYSPRRLERDAFGAFQGAGMDVFTDPTSQDPNKFLDLTNVMPALTGGFQRRWGLTGVSAASSYSTQFQRIFNYNAEADTSFAGSVTRRCLLGTDDTNINFLWAETGGTGAAGSFTAFSGNGEVHATTSRNWFYAFDGVDPPQKKDLSQDFANTQSLVGITNSAAVFSQTFGSTGSGYTTTPTLTFTSAVGSGATAIFTSAGSGLLGGLSTKDIQITNGGSGYTVPPAVTVTGGGGSGAQFLAVIGQDSTSPFYQTVIGVISTGQMLLNSGRAYGVACKNSVTGHTSDIKYSVTSGSLKTGLMPVLGATIGGVPTNSTDYNTWINKGFDYMEVSLTYNANDPQVDTVVLLATSDGGDLQHMYEVAQIPASSFGGGILPYQDNTPDTYNDIYSTGATLLTANLWVDVDQSGDVIGIFQNTPPQSTLNKPVVYLGRVFATDGLSLYYSKSIDEVTTSTGLITSKWEEAWPSTNELDLNFDGEILTALLTDGSTLYIGSTDNIYALTGANASTFSIPNSVFRGVGVKSQDVWSVIYKDNVPAGFAWVTNDNKIMLSDFNTYTEIGKAIYPIINGGTITHVQGWSYGPYSFAAFSVKNAIGTYILLYDTKHGGWYRWTRTNASPSGSYIVPLFTYTNLAGSSYLYSLQSATPASTSKLFFFDPTSVQDQSIASFTAGNFPWSIQTSWLNLQDTASNCILNELEIWSDDPDINVSVYKAQNSGDFASPILVKTGAPVTGPMRQSKFFLAGANSLGRYHTVQFFTNSSTGLSNASNVLRQFQFEHFAQTRI